MSRDVITVGSTMRIPLLYRGEYSQWRERFMNYLEEQTEGEAMINSIQNDDQPLHVIAQVSLAGNAQNAPPALKYQKLWIAKEKKTRKIDRLARSLLIQGLPNDIYSLIDSNETGKDLWDALERHMRGSEYGEQDRKSAILYEYETFKAIEGDKLLDTYLRYLQVINDLKKCSYKKDNCELNYKFLNNLQQEWKQYATLMRQTKNLMDISIDALYNILKQNQGDVNDALGYKKKVVVVHSDPLALVAEKTNITALLAKAFNRRNFYSKPTNNNLRTSSTSQSANKKQEFIKTDNKKVEKKDDEKKRDISRVKCYNYKEGHFAKDCKKVKVKDYEYYKIKMLLAKKDKDEQVLLAEDQAWMESSSDSDQEINANMVFMAQIEKVLSDSEASLSSADEKISEVSYYLSEFESESEFETSEYYDNSSNFGLFVNNDDDKEIFHDATESASESFIENHIDSQKDYDKYDVDHNDSEEKDHLVDKLIRNFNKKIVKCHKRVEKANQQSKDFKNQNKDLQDKYDVLKNQVNTFEEKNNEFNEQIKVLKEKNDDLLDQTKVLKDKLQVKHVVIDTYVECHEKYAKLEAERYKYMIRYYALFDNDKQHRKQIVDQEVLFDKMSVELVELDKHVIDLKNTVLEKDFKISELEECVRNKDLEIEKCLERLNDCENKLHKMGQTNQTVHMIMPSKDNFYNGRKGIGFENPSYFEKAKDLRPTLYDEKVIGLGYTLMFLKHSDEALEIKKFKRSRENKIEFAYDYRNLNASYVNEKIKFSDDYFQEIINPDFEKIDSSFQQTISLKLYVPNMILEKIIIDLEDEVVSLLEKEKANLETIESLKSKGFESSENVSSESENQTENDCLVVEKEYDKEENPKVIALSKMSFRKKPRDSMNVRSKSNSNKSLPRTVHKWLPKLQPLAEPIIQINLWIIDSGCSKHMMGNRALLTNFVEKFLRTVRFGNNDFAVIAGYGDVVIGSMTIKKVYYVEGLGHNLFSVGQFCDNGLEVAFRKSTCFVRNKNGVDLFTSDRSSNLYTIALNEVASNSSTCLLAKASSSQSWLWHQRLSHLNFVTINNLVKNNFGQGLPKIKFEKDHLCSACEQGKIHRKHHKSKTAFASNKPFYLLHMDLCGSIRVQSINGKRYVSVVVDDYSLYTWVFFLHSKDEASEDVGKLKAKGDIRVFVGYSKEYAAFTIYNKRTRKIHEEKSSNPSVSKVSKASKKDLEDLFQDFYDEYFDSSKIMKSPTTNVESSNVEVSSPEEEVFHEISDSFQGESSSSLLNDDVQQSPEEVILPQTNTQSISNNMVPNVDEAKEAYVGQPPGFVSKKYPDHVYALDKALYVPTLMVEQAKLKLDLVGKPVDHTDYRSMIGSLIYVTSSRPDIMFATCMCARYHVNPNEHHVSAIKRIFRYIKGTINLGLWYPKDYGFDLTAYSDADHAGCHLDRKSTYGSVQFLGDKLVCWSFKKYNYVSISTAESEYVAVFSCCAQVLWMRTQLTDYGFF
nr:uncharacterized mitochondrial protein AtMg00810-like [Tanacetum cinerariifolium]